MGSKLLIVCASFALLVGCHGAPPGAQSPAAEKDIRALIGRWTRAFDRRDVDAVMAIYLPGDALVVYGPPGDERGAAALRQDYARFFSRYRGPLRVGYRDLHVIAGDDVAFSFGYQGIAGTLTNGSASEEWIRFTQGYRKVNGRWYAVHDHVSLPPAHRPSP